MAFMPDRGLFLSLQAIRRQLAAMPHDPYLVRLIHHATRRAFPGERLWTATESIEEPTVRFLRIRNREGCDVYIQPYAENLNAGYILLDLDHADPAALELMRARGHEPCVVLQTSPGRLQAWIRVSAAPLEPAVATAIGGQLARAYRGDLASADWRHLGRLAGFTNQKPLRRQPNGYAPWVRVLHTRVGLATHGASLVEAAHRQVTCTPGAAADQGQVDGIVRAKPGGGRCCAGRTQRLPSGRVAVQRTPAFLFPAPETIPLCLRCAGNWTSSACLSCLSFSSRTYGV